MYILWDILFPEHISIPHTLLLPHNTPGNGHWKHVGKPLKLWINICTVITFTLYLQHILAEILIKYMSNCIFLHVSQSLLNHISAYELWQRSWHFYSINSRSDEVFLPLLSTNSIQIKYPYRKCQEKILVQYPKHYVAEILQIT